MRWLTVPALALALTGVASGYYHFLRFPSRAGGTGIPEKYDLNALPNKTLRFYVAETGPTRLAADDSFSAVLSQIKLAADTWSNVDSSDIRLAFGGLINPDTPQNAPGVDVVFDDDLPPGVIAQGFPLSYDYSAVSPNAGFIPVLRSKVRLRKDLTQVPLLGGGVRVVDTFDELFFITLVHEFGHALGLQHSLTGSTMSTDITRGTTKARPLSADDIAGITVLYPAKSYLDRAGVVRGRVTLGGTGVNMASVVVISPNGPAISALSNPDGTYEIQGIPPGNYSVYAHPLPPANSVEQYPGDILPPLDRFAAGGTRINTRQVFSTQFYNGTLSIATGSRIENVNFAVQSRPDVPVFNVQTYGFIGSVAVKPPPVNAASAGTTVYAQGNGLATADGNPVAGLNIEVLGGSRAIPGSIKRYQAGYIQFDVAPGFGDGPRHLLFDAFGDRYVLPNAFNLIQRPAPTITSVTAATDDSGNPAALISGSWISGESRFLFDGEETRVLKVNSDGTILVSLPAAAPGHKARVVALNADGQSSLFTQGRNAYIFTYEGTNNSSFGLNISSLPVGSESVIEINGTNTSFAEAETILGFGSSDILVRQLWVIAPNRAMANVYVQPQTALGNTSVSISNGIQLMTSPLPVVITPANSRLPVVYPASLLNRVTNLPGIWPGAGASIDVAGLNTTNAGSVTLTLADQRVPVTSIVGNTIFFQVPASLARGPVVVRVQNSTGDTSLPVAVAVEATPPVIRSALAGSSTVLDSTRWVKPTDLMTVVASNLYDSTGRGSVKVTIGGVEHDPVAVLGGSDGTHQVQVVIASQVAAGNQVPVTVSVGNRISQPITIVVRAN